jgi:hypothetical protein
MFESLHTASIITLVMEAVSISEMSVSIYQTAQHNVPEDSHLHACHCKNLKSHLNSLIAQAIISVSMSCLVLQITLLMESRQ